MKRIIKRILLIAVVIVVLFFALFIASGFILTEPCHNCGTENKLLNSYCSNCNETTVHIWSEATCMTPKTCAVCGEVEGETVAHSWNEATCMTPKTCAVCGKTEGDVLDHSWNKATCTTPKTCKWCDKTEGENLGHNWEFVDYKNHCKRCGEEKDIDYSKSYDEALAMIPAYTPLGDDTSLSKCDAAINKLSKEVAPEYKNTKRIIESYYALKDSEFIGYWDYDKNVSGVELTRNLNIYFVFDSEENEEFFLYAERYITYDDGTKAPVESQEFAFSYDEIVNNKIERHDGTWEAYKYYDHIWDEYKWNIEEEYDGEKSWYE